MLVAVVGCQQIRIDIVHALAVQQVLSESQRLLPSLSHLVFPVAENVTRLPWCFDLFSRATHETRVKLTGKTEDGFAEIFFEFLAAGAPLEFLRIKDCDWLKAEM